MTKVVSSYESVVRGVSEQVPHQRHSGQHYEQVNMVSDPVRGLARRQGSVTLDEQLLPGVTESAANAAYARCYREYSFFIDGIEYSVIYPTQAKPAGATLPFMFAVNKATGKIMPVTLSGNLAPYIEGGISSVTAVGQFLAFAGRNVSAGYGINDLFTPYSSHGVATIRTGAYSRTYTLTIRRADNGQQLTGTYTTMASSYPNLLDTSDLQASDPNYQKYVNDRVYAYNSAVTKWIGDAQRDIQPANIAARIADNLYQQGFPNIATHGGVIVFTNVTEAQSGDGADGDSFRTVFNEVDDPVKLSGKHAPWKVVKVNPKGAEPYYMRAHPENPSLGDWQNVTWKECPKEEVVPGTVFALATLHVSNGSLVVADTPANLQAASGIPVPGFNRSVAGSTADVGGLPYFFGRRISCLTVFQDRLIIIANGTIFASRTGDYFNWFRKSKLTVADDDPVEMYALGAEDDIIRAAVSYNKDLFLFGERKQYSVAGRTALTPKSAAVTATAGERDAVDMHPVTLGNLLFYGKSRPAALQVGPSKFASEISQFQLGLYQDTPETYPVSQQLSLYLRGKPSQAVPLSSPNTIMLRTDGYDHGVYLYTYLDSPGSQDRTFDSWSRWEWSDAVGRLVSMSHYKNRLLAYVLRTNESGTWLGVEQFTTDASESDRPYLDMQRWVGEYKSGAGFLRPAHPPEGGYVVATAEAGDIKYMGASIDKLDSYLTDFFPTEPDPYAVVGVAFDAYFDLTPPYTRDRNGVAIVSGRLVLTKYVFRVANTGGMEAFLSDHHGLRTQRVLTFNGRRVGLSNNLVGIQPSTDAFLTAPVGRANAEHRLKVAAHTWLPMTVSAISWNGHYFNNSRQG